MQIFNNMVYNSANKCSIDILQKSRSLAEELANKGLSRSGTAVERTYRLINDKVLTYLDELLKEINDFIKDFEVVLTDEELEGLFTNLNSYYISLIESSFRTRKEYLDANQLEDSMFDYKTNLVQKCTHKINTEKQNLQIKIKLLDEKIKRQGISIGQNTGQANIAFGGTIIANNDMTLINIIKLKFYLSGHIEPSDTMNKVNIKDLGEPEKITEIKTEIVNLVNTIKAIKLDESEAKYVDKPITGAFMETVAQITYNGLAYHGGGPVRISDEDRNKIMERLNNYFDIEVNENEFFNLGNLGSKKVPGVSGINFTMNEEYFGKEFEIKKKKLIDGLRFKLLLLDTYHGLSNYLNGFSLVPLVLINEGKVLNEGIEVHIKIPSQYEILTAKNDELAFSSYLFDNSNDDDERFVEKYISHKQDRRVTSFPNSMSKLTQGLTTAIGYIGRNRTTEDDIEVEKGKLEDFFNYEIYKEKDYTVLKYEFPMLTDTLRPTELMALPTYLFIKADEQIQIQYEIVSNQSIDNKFEPLTYSVL